MAGMTPAPSADAFEQAKELFLKGLDSFKAGHFADAEQHFLASLHHVPGRISTLVNLAATRLLLGRPAEALASADAVLAIEADSFDAWLHRATALCDLSRHDEAARGFERALALDGSQSEAWSRYGHVLAALHRNQDALHAYERALALQPALPEIWSRYGELLRELARFDEAAVAFETAIRHGADAELNGYYLAAVRGASMPTRAPDAYVQGLFDGYAADFEQHLVGQLGYRAHEVLTRHLAQLGRGPYQSALDLGCGTGLCGPLVRPHAARLTGVDLSGPMLDKARALGIYDELVQADVTRHLQGTPHRHDLILAADVFIYVGELEPVFAALRRVALPGAVFCFTAELPADAAQSVQLLPSLRYAHSERYLRRLAGDHGFGVLDLLVQPVRDDQRKSVDGLYVYLQRI
jgi:predicted TPR repeat methyltransferase